MKPTTTWHDPVVAELHAIRERLASQYNNDMQAYTDAAQAHCLALGMNLIQTAHTEQKASPVQPTAAM